jgi:tRNA (guanine-N7-)-methyltransferase
MAKNKLQRFEELKSFPNTFQYMHFERGTDLKLKGKWNSEHFKNNNPIVLELGCGKAEYTLGLGEKYPHKNFIGVDLKGARIWRGAKTALEKKIPNVAFLRSQIDFIEHCFAKNEISEIWITFPDPQKEKPRKRLTHFLFLARYKNILQHNGIIHLKTDSLELHEFTLEVIAGHALKLIDATNDLYGGDTDKEREEVKSIKTHYEKLFTDMGKKITYIKFTF